MFKTGAVDIWEFIVLISFYMHIYIGYVFDTYEIETFFFLNEM